MTAGELPSQEVTDYFCLHNPNIRKAEELWQRKQALGKCWEWWGSKNSKGYGKTALGKYRRMYAHRLMMVKWYGMDPDDTHQVLHRCDNPSCVNPKHLYLGTNQENQQDSVNKKRHVNARKSSCKRGHPFDEGNTMWRVRNYGPRKGRRFRQCITCTRNYFKIKEQENGI